VNRSLDVVRDPEQQYGRADRDRGGGEALSPTVAPRQTERDAASCEREGQAEPEGEGQDEQGNQAARDRSLRGSLGSSFLRAWNDACEDDGRQGKRQSRAGT